MGTHGTMIVEGEKSVMLFTEQQPGQKGTSKSIAVGVSTTGKDKPALESGSTWGGPAAGPGRPPLPRAPRAPQSAAAIAKKWKISPIASASGTRSSATRKAPTASTSSAYRSAHGEVALADAIVALSANRAMKTHQRIVFKEGWFDGDALSEVPDGEGKPKVPVT